MNKFSLYRTKYQILPLKFVAWTERLKAFVYSLGQENFNHFFTLWCYNFSPWNRVVACFIINIIFHYSNVYMLYCNDNIFVSLLVFHVEKWTQARVIYAKRRKENKICKFMGAQTRRGDLGNGDDFMLLLKNTWHSRSSYKCKITLRRFFASPPFFFGTFSPTQLDTLWFYTLASAYKHLHNIIFLLFRRCWTEFRYSNISPS